MVCSVYGIIIITDDYVPEIDHVQSDTRYRPDGAVLNYVNIKYTLNKGDNLRVRSLRGNFWLPNEVPPQAYFGHPPQPLPYEFPAYRSLSIRLDDTYQIVFCTRRYDSIEHLALYRTTQCVSNDYVDLGRVTRDGKQAPQRLTNPDQI